MDSESKWLEKLNVEIANVTAKIEGAEAAWLNAKKDQDKAEHKEVRQHVVKRKEALIVETDLT